MITEHGWTPQMWVDLERRHKAFVIASITKQAKALEAKNKKLKQSKRRH